MDLLHDRLFFSHTEIALMGNGHGQDIDRVSQGSGPIGRRGFLRRGAIATSAAAGAAALMHLGPSGVGGPEEAHAQTTGRVTLSQQMQLVQRHENDHVNFIVAALGTAARPKPTFQNLLTPNVGQFLTLARTFENVGVGAYLGAAPVIFSRERLAAAGSILAVEARHAGMFNLLQSRAMTENVFGQELSFERPLTIQEVVDAAGPFIASLNGGAPLTFDSTPSDANDVAILNFALALEYLEAEFYNLNVPRFYR